MSKFKFCVACTALLFGGSVSAGQLIVTPSSSSAKSGVASIALDVVTDGNAAGFNFFVRTGELKRGSVDLSKCVSELPKGFVGTCAQRADGVGVIAYSESNGTLPAGMTPVGSLGIPAALLGKGSAITIEELTFADSSGDRLQAESIIASE